MYSGNFGKILVYLLRTGTNSVLKCVICLSYCPEKTKEIIRVFQKLELFVLPQSFFAD